jgi:hypothetical protein
MLLLVMLQKLNQGEFLVTVCSVIQKNCEQMRVLFSMACLSTSLPFLQISLWIFFYMLHSHYFDNSYCSQFKFPYRQQYLTCGSIMSGQRSELERMVAFSVDILSLGSPSLFHTAI